MYRIRANAYSIPNDLMIHQIHFCPTKSPIGFWLHCFILSAARHCSSSLIEYAIWKYTHPNCIVLKLNFHPIQRYQTKWSNFDSGTSAAATTHNSIMLQAPVFLSTLLLGKTQLRFEIDWNIVDLLCQPFNRSHHEISVPLFSVRCTIANGARSLQCNARCPNRKC